MRTLALFAIQLYKQYISPFKGFSCAYRVHTGGCSCSTLGQRAIRRHGLGPGLAILNKRLRRCGVAHRRFGSQPAPRRLGAQAGLCDFSCDLPCEISGAKLCGIGEFLADFLSCCDCCDWRRSRKRADEEKYVHIPPMKSRPARWPKEERR